MQHTKISLATFESILALTDWIGRNRTINPADRINGLTSIAYAADCYLDLTPKDRITSARLVRKYAPVDWRGWPIAVNAAKRGRKAFERAIEFGIFSDNRQADTYHGHYFYTHSDDDYDYFKHSRTFKAVESPCSKKAISKQAVERIFWNTKK